MYKKSGFTLIELLVVISIIGLLSSIVLTNLAQAKRKAQYAKAQAEITQLQQVFLIVTGETGRVLGVERRPGRPPGITESGSTSWLCREVAGAPADLRNLPDDHPCMQNWISALTKIEQTSGGMFTDLSRFRRDPWGSPYILDENEGEQAADPCRRDWIGTVGADGRGAGGHGGDNYIKVLPLYSAGCAR
jgi:prepilin-type N-terminal cleavage/methylation domain-containing protein